MTFIKKDIESVKLFSGLPDEALEECSKHADVLEFSKGEILFEEGDPPAHLWCIITGEVKVFKEYASGKTAIIGIFGQGSVIAEVAVIDGRPYPASCQAVIAGRAVKIEKNEALRIITSNPSVAHTVMAGLSSKMRSITDDLGSMAVQTVIRRLSRFLLNMGGKMGKVEKGKGLRVELFLTRKELAECIGTSFEVAVRCLGRLQSDGVIEVDGKNILIKDKGRLKNLADNLDGGADVGR